MFEKEAEEYIKEHTFFDEEFGLTSLDVTSKTAFQDGAEFGYNKGYHDAEEHYLNVIDNQHKLVNESKKKDFRKCMKCTDGTYQSGFKDGYNKANEWHYVKDEGLPNKELEEEQLLVRVRNYTENYLFAYYMKDKYCSKNGKRFYSDTDCDYPIDIEDIIAWKEIVLPELKEGE